MDDRLAAAHHGRARKAGVVIDVRRFGQPLFYCALPGSSPDNAEWVRRKSNLVARFHRSSYRMGLEVGAHLFEKYALPMTDFAAHGGSFPICVQGAGVIGSITVSGLPQRAITSSSSKRSALRSAKITASWRCLSLPFETRRGHYGNRAQSGGDQNSMCSRKAGATTGPRSLL